ncbi:MAG TPA: hypothetical protein DEE98_08750 [Elusimicrobia bacterium]|nr:MAG: hypothetical protein A2204_04540 [Elusimicrobia bacterium RIFOXYA1_FULL_47_7]OGS10846.1 MAG: hypothetical protein A2386_03025 [Elusimicrobia bacterium RIFOXYB1_FULL_48_9]OGS15693.1 MAG: hypothetical protein A2251_08370 [Elusimicrobia bacterium RIFOXYA2_FULL_47_53]OGS27088.1 MAG: hypothetical protein A2339_01250 [Elusimicrobia bacterium RIFOXYB12_FULL_50_12]OGS30994.1 MAG: hypothetical protein A2323_06690 [Elusimicrobia bacterium RIFOXYB2_FULL_46_23]HBU70450.1 hypothetical protein [Elus
MGNSEYKRSRIWIEPAIQVKYVFFNVVFLLVFALIIGAGVYVGIWRSVTREFSEVRLNEDLQTVTRMREYEAARTRQAIEVVPFMKQEAKMLSQHQRNVLNKILVRTNKNLIPLLSALFIFIIISSLVLSHRFAGPIYRLKKNLGAVASGDLTGNYSLRSKDELKDLAAEIKALVTLFSDFVTLTRDAAKALRVSGSDDERNSILSEIELAASKYKIQSEK